MKGKEKPKLWLRGILLIIMVGLFISGSDTFWKWYLPYIDTANYDQMMKEYNGFVGMPLEKVIKLLTKDGRYVIISEDGKGPGLQEVISPYEQVPINGCSVLCFPVQNSKSREECFAKGFLLDESSVILAPVDIWLSTDSLFAMIV